MDKVVEKFAYFTQPTIASISPQYKHLALFAIGESISKNLPKRAVCNPAVATASTKIATIWAKYSTWIKNRNIVVIHITPSLIQLMKEENRLFGTNVAEWDVVVGKICECFESSFPAPVGPALGKAWGDYFALIRPNPLIAASSSAPPAPIPNQAPQFKSKYIRASFNAYMYLIHTKDGNAEINDKIRREAAAEIRRKFPGRTEGMYHKAVEELFQTKHLDMFWKWHHALPMEEQYSDVEVEVDEDAPPADARSPTNSANSAGSAKSNWSSLSNSADLRDLARSLQSDRAIFKARETIAPPRKTKKVQIAQLELEGVEYLVDVLTMDIVNASGNVIGLMKESTEIPGKLEPMLFRRAPSAQNN